MTDTEMQSDSTTPPLPTRPAPETELRYIVVRAGAGRKEEKNEVVGGLKSTTIERPE